MNEEPVDKFVTRRNQEVARENSLLMLEEMNRNIDALRNIYGLKPSLSISEGKFHLDFPVVSDGQ